MTKTTFRPLPTLVVLLALAALTSCGGGGAPDTASALGERKRALSTSTATDPNATLALEVVVMTMNGQPIQHVASAYGATVMDQFGRRPIYRLRLDAAADVEVTLTTMRADARLRFAERNVAAETPEGLMQVVWAVGGSVASYQTQWAPTALALPQAHAVSTGAGVRVALLDGGVDLAHPQLAPRLARAGGGTPLGRDFVDGDDDPSETGSAADRGWGHGTHVAGLVALAAPGARLMPVRVLDNAGRGNAWVLAEALMWAIDPDGDPATDDGAHIVNISLGTTQPTRLMNTAIELATCSDNDEEAEDDYSDAGFDADKERCNQLHGVVVTAAAGNAGSATQTLYPAAERAEGQLAVTATDPQRRLASFSNSGPWVQVAAPGDRIISTMPGGGYATWSGTSMAAPLAAGVAALVLQRYPDWKPVDVAKRLAERSIRLCGNTDLRGLHALGAVADFVPGDPYCPGS